MRKILVYSSVAFLGFLGGLVAGSLPSSEPHRPPKVEAWPGRQDRDLSRALGVDLPDDPFLNLRGRGNTAVGLKRTQDCSVISSLAVHNPDAPAGNRVYLGFHEATGSVSEVLLVVAGKYIRRWRFRPDASLESETVFERDADTSSHKGIETYYDEAGRPQRTQRVIVSHGS